MQNLSENSTWKTQKDNILINLKETASEDANWIHPFQNRVHRRVLVSMVMNLQIQREESFSFKGITLLHVDRYWFERAYYDPYLHKLSNCVPHRITSLFLIGMQGTAIEFL